MVPKVIVFTLLIFAFSACTSPSTPPPDETVFPATMTLIATSSVTLHASSATASEMPTDVFTETPAATETPSPVPSRTPVPTVESLTGTVTADLLSCRYGPGPEYLYLFAFRKSAPVRLIGRVDTDNWKWALVENQVPCWVHTDFLDVQGDIRSLPVVYPGLAKLPITPYYPRSQVLRAERDNETNEITVSWVEVPVSPGDYEDDSMQTYIVEVWRCQAGQLIFDPLATRLTFITFVDEPGCSEPSHGRVWVQEKHGYAGPADIPWPPYNSQTQ